MLNRRPGLAGLARMVRPLRPLRLLYLALAVGLLAGCAASMPVVERPASTVRTAPPDAPLARLAHDAVIAAGLSGVYPLPQASFALDARLALIAAARDSLDLQCCVLADDGIGHLILRGLRDAAQRGVRLRLLRDDLHTTGMDRLLLGLAAEPNVELRLFNPFVSGRESTLVRALGLLVDLRRLNHRMHNKLFIADAAVAIVGGRNLCERVFPARHGRQLHRLRPARRRRGAAGAERRLRRLLEQRPGLPRARHRSTWHGQSGPRH